MRRYANGYEPKRNPGCNHINYKPNRPYFIGKSGALYDYDGVARTIHRHDDFRRLIGQPALKQLDVIGLKDEFENGITPFQIPGTFLNQIPSLLQP